VDYAIGHADDASDEAVAALGGWATSAPRLAQAWLEALPDSDTKEALVYGLLDGWSTSDFHAAAAYAESRPASPVRDRFRDLLLQRALRAGGIPAAQSWVDGIPENDQNRAYKQRAFSGVVQAMLYRDPAAAARWISNLDGQSFVAADAVMNTALKLAEKSPDDALQWMASLKPADVNGVGNGAGTVLQKWAQQDASAAGAWLQANTAHPFYDHLAASYVRSVASSDPSVAKEWAQSIREPKFREQTLAALAQPISFEGHVVYGTESLGSDSNAPLYLVADTFQSTSSFALTQGMTGQMELSANQLTVTNAALPTLSLKTTESQKANPHGSSPKWRNCASCHAQ
jgi:hypothetical protein